MTILFLNPEISFLFQNDIQYTNIFESIFFKTTLLSSTTVYEKPFLAYLEERSRFLQSNNVTLAL